MLPAGSIVLVPALCRKDGQRSPTSSRRSPTNGGRVDLCERHNCAVHSTRGRSCDKERPCVREPSGTCGRATILVSMLPTESFLYLRPMTLQALAKGLDVSSAVRRYKTDLLREDRGIQIRRRPNGIRIEVKPRYFECGTLKREGIHDTKTSKPEVHDLLHRMTSFYLNGRRQKTQHSQKDHHVR
jgi:hypothetical protein